jgi:uroporphyrinogen decarboxylase
MTSKERLMTTLNHKEPDRVPLDLGVGGSCKISLILYKKLLDYFGIKEDLVCCGKLIQMALASDAFLEKMECDPRTPFPVQIPSRPLKEWEDAEGYYMQDDWGTISRMPKVNGHYYDLVGPPMAGTFDDESKTYTFPEVPEISPKAAEQARAYRKAGYPVILPDPYGNGFLQTAPKIYGYEDWMMMLALDDKRAAWFMDTLLENKMKYWDKVAAAFGDSVDIVVELDDLGTQSGPFIDPGMVRKKLKPYYRKLYDHIHKVVKAKVFMHSCGSVVKLIPDLIDAGVDILNPVQINAAGMEPAFLKKEYGKDIVFWGGGIDTQRVLPGGTKQEIRDHVKRNIEIFGKDGGFVFATVHNAQSDVPPENFITMWETFKEFRNY